MPSSSLVKVEVEVGLEVGLEVGVEVEVGVESSGKGLLLTQKSPSWGLTQKQPFPTTNIKYSVLKND